MYCTWGKLKGNFNLKHVQYCFRRNENYQSAIAVKVIYLSKGVTRILIQGFVITRADLGLSRGKRGHPFLFDNILYYIRV